MLPGDARIVIDMPPAESALTRRGTITITVLDGDGVPGESRTCLLSLADELLVTSLVVGKGRGGSCGPSFFF